MAARSVAVFPVGGLEFQPVAGSDAGTVRTVDTFRDDALDVEFGACVKEIAWGTVERADGAKGAGRFLCRRCASPPCANTSGARQPSDLLPGRRGR